MSNFMLRSAFLRFALLIVFVAALDGLVVWLVAKPFLWASVIPALIPLLVYPVVIQPMLRKR